MLRVLWKKHFPALLTQPRCCGILPCHRRGLCHPALSPRLTPCLSCPCCSLTWKHFPTVQTHKRTIFPGSPVQEVSSHPRFLLTDCFEQFAQEHSTLSAFLQIWLNLDKRCYRRGAKRQKHTFMQCESMSHQRRNFILYLCVLFLLSSSIVF